MRIAIAQLSMHGTPEQNTRSIVDHLVEASGLAADLVVFPECATTGYHRRVPEQISRSGITAAIGHIQVQCAALGLPAVVGTPYYASPDEDHVWNAAVAIDADGQIGAVCAKAGLTESEHRFFHPGTARPSFSVGALRCSVLLCREVRDAEAARSELGSVDVVFWPGVITWNGTEDVHPESVVTVEIAQQCARTLGSYLIQCNWSNSVNRPELRGMGGSLVVSPLGEVLYRCPTDEAGIAVVDMDASGGVGHLEFARSPTKA